VIKDACMRKQIIVQILHFKKPTTPNTCCGFPIDANNIYLGLTALSVELVLWRCGARRRTLKVYAAGTSSKRLLHRDHSQPTHNRLDTEGGVITAGRFIDLWKDELHSQPINNRLDTEGGGNDPRNSGSIGREEKRDSEFDTLSVTGNCQGRL